MAKRKTWEAGNDIAFGTNESSFNSTLVEQLKDHPNCYANKVAGSFYKKGNLDVLGQFRGSAIFLEQKFIKKPLKADSKERVWHIDSYSPGQIEFMEGMVRSLRGVPKKAVIVGSLVAVYGDTNFIFGVRAEDILCGLTLTRGDLHYLRETVKQAERRFLHLTRRLDGELRYGVVADLHHLLERMRYG